MRYNSSMEELGINSRNYLLWNNTLGTVVAEKDADTQTPVASLTKIMTALVTLERRQLDEMVEITPAMLQGLEEFAIIGLQAGQKVTVEDLLYATMLPSAGDAAQALAISTSGTIAEFAELMNQKAAELGMQQTHFSNPVGFDEENYSTAQDIAILLRAALQNPTFVRIFETFETELPTLGRTATKTFAPQNYIRGGKTGFTNLAGRCLASTAEVEGTEYILVSIGAEAGKNVADANKIYNYVAEHYEPQQILAEGTVLMNLPVQQSKTKSLQLTAPQNVTVALSNETELTDLHYSYGGLTEITAQTEPQTKLGTYVIRQGETTLYTQDLYYTEVIEFYNYSYVWLGALISIAILGITIWQSRRRKGRMEKKVALVGFSLFVVSLIINILLFHTWFEPAGDLGIYQPEVVSQEGPEPEPGETSTPGEQVEPTGLKLNSTNCTTNLGNLMLINPNFVVDSNFIQARRQQLVSVSQTYGIPEYHPAGNGDNLMIPEAAEQLSQMVAAYRAEYPGHEIGTYSCFRERGTQCGRLCAATGASDHHTGLTCDLIDLTYGSILDTDDYGNHVEWQWLRENSYKFGFIDRFPEAWAGGSMAEPLNVDENGTTGLYETWHYRYVGVTAATEIATGKYNNGQYDSLEHYLKMRGLVTDLKAGLCQ